MKHARSSMTTEIINDYLYVFGGEQENETPFASIEVCALPRPTTSPTLDPSVSPTHKPSTSPTREPSVSPMREPSAPPTRMHMPSISPTGNPSKYPTVVPSTVFPTDNPSTHPTLQPTKDPSHVTSDPTPNPTTSNPTNVPIVTPVPAPTLVVSVMESTVSLRDFKDTMVTTPSTGKVHGNNPANLEPLLWISLGIFSIVLVVCIIVCVNARRVQKADKARKNTGVYIEAVNVKANNSAMVEMISEREPVHLDIQPAVRENDNKQPIKEPVQKDITELIEWLTSKVKLHQYVSNFVDNGYETLEFVCDISNAEDLQDIGVTLKEHQMRILTQIKRLKAPQEEKEQNERQGLKKQRSMLDELEGENEAVIPLALEGSPTEEYSNDVVMDIQGGVTLGSFPQDRKREIQPISPKVKYVFDVQDDEEVNTCGSQRTTGK
eukprot:116909_1